MARKSRDPEIIPLGREGIAVPHAMLPRYVLPYTYVHLVTPQFAQASLARREVITRGKKKPKDQQGYTLFTYEARPRPLMQRFMHATMLNKKPLWSEALVLRSLRWLLPHSDEFTLAATSFFSPLVPGCESASVHFPIVALSGNMNQKEKQLIIKSITIGRKLHMPTPRRVEAALTTLGQCADYVRANKEQLPFSPDYLDMAKLNLAPMFGTVARQELDSIALLRRQVVKFHPRSQREETGNKPR